jgi:hypothetical protein
MSLEILVMVSSKHEPSLTLDHPRNFCPISSEVLSDFIRSLAKVIVGQAYSLTVFENMDFGGLQTRPMNIYARG